MQELTFEQVEVVSGGFVGLGDGTVRLPNMNEMNGLILGQVVGGVTGAIGGGLAAVMTHSGGSKEGTPLSEILKGAAMGAVQGVISPATGVSSVLRVGVGYVGAGVVGYVLNGAGNP
jgi:hypothetical protein